MSILLDYLKRLFAVFFVFFFVGLGFCEERILTVDEAFEVRAQLVNEALVFDWVIAPGHYLYKASIKIKHGETLISVDYPNALPFADPFKDDVMIYRDSLRIDSRTAREILNVGEPVTAFYQGCADQGICYPPHRRTFQMNTQGLIVPIGSASEGGIVPTSGKSFSQKLVDLLGVHSWWVSCLLFLLIGLLLSLTPCVYPMIPILSKMIVHRGADLTVRHAFGVSVFYVVGMAVAYALVGLIVAMLGVNLLVLWQKPAVLIGVALLFFLFGFAMWGWVVIDIPARLNTWVNRCINRISERLVSYEWLGSLIIGFLSALIISPCVTPALAAVLLYISSTGQVVLGSTYLFFMGLGMGVPLILFGAGLGRWLPKKGHWLFVIEHALGWILLAVGIVILERVFTREPGLWVIMPLWIVWLLLAAVKLGAFRHEGRRGEVVLGWVFCGCAGLLLWANVQGIRSPWMVHHLWQGSEHILVFDVVDNLDDMDKLLEQAQSAQRPAFVDVYADWCTYCQILEHKILPSASIQASLNDFRRIKLDMTDFDKERLTRLLARWQIVAPPMLLFIGADGNERQELRLIGEMTEGQILTRLQLMNDGR